MLAADALGGAARSLHAALREFEQAIELSLLSAIEDPFDRMIVAAARVLRAPLLTADAEMHAAALVSVTWD